jgi:thiosulfate/3-mercaptopyruvate sulfurtransferase
MRDLSWEAANSPRPSIALLDARPPEEFAGSRPNPSLPRAGHIPGAVSLYWMNTLDSNDDPELLPPADLRKLFAKAGIAPGRKVVTYCVTGMQASFAYFVARYLGYEAAMYDGSLIEWNKSPDAPLVTSIK